MSARSASASASVEGGRTRPEGIRPIVGPWGVQSRCGLGAREPFRWPSRKPEKSALYAFPAMSGCHLTCPTQTPDTNALRLKWFYGTHSGLLIRLRKGRADLHRRGASSCRPASLVSRRNDLVTGTFAAKGGSVGREI